jgi:hypothetical protein
MVLTLAAGSLVTIAGTDAEKVSVAVRGSFASDETTSALPMAPTDAATSTSKVMGR